MTRCRQILRGLPDHNYAVLSYLMGFLHEVRAGQGCRGAWPPRQPQTRSGVTLPRPRNATPWLQRASSKTWLAVTPPSSPGRCRPGPPRPTPATCTAALAVALGFLSWGLCSHVVSCLGAGAWGREPGGRGCVPGRLLGEARGLAHACCARGVEEESEGGRGVPEETVEGQSQRVPQASRPIPSPYRWGN